MRNFLLSVILLALLATARAQPWTRITVPTTAGLRGLSIVSDRIIWASGTGGAVIRTTDGGKTWALLSVAGAQDLDFRGVHAFDGSTALIVSAGPAEKGQARIYRTSDGGKSWKQVFESKTPGIFLDAIAFWDRRRGIVLSDPVNGRFVLFTTSDGGASWKQIPEDALPKSLPNEGAFAASNSCLAVQGKADVWFATGGATVARVFHSGDGGKSWTVAQTPMQPKNSSSGIFSLRFNDAQHGIASGGDYQHPEASDLPSVMRTSDGGKTWRAAEATEPAGVYLSSIIAARAGEKDYVLAAGISGLWSGAAGGELKKESSENLNTVAGSGSNAWVVGAKGVVLKKALSK